jgi:hypothetical protein
MFKTAQTFICIGPNCWGAAATLQGARQNMRRNLPRLDPGRRYTIHCVATDAPRETIRLTDCGSLSVEIPKEYATITWPESVKVPARGR